MRPTVLALALIAGLAQPAVSAAQPGAVPDSIVAHHMGAATIRELYYRIARAAFSDSTRPVLISLPPGPAWSKIERQILVALRGRPPRPDDRRMQIVEIDQVHFRNDSLSARISIGETWRCGATWMGDHTDFVAVTVRVGVGWTPVTTRAILFSDGAPCGEPPGGLSVPPQP